MVYTQPEWSAFTKVDTDDGRKPEKAPHRDPDWVKREIKRHQELGLDWSHLKKYMTKTEKLKNK